MKHKKKTTIEQRSADLNFATHYLALRVILVIVATAGLALSAAAIADPALSSLPSSALRVVALVAIVLAHLLLWRNGKKWLKERDGNPD